MVGSIAVICGGCWTTGSVVGLRSGMWSLNNSSKLERYSRPKEPD